MSSGLDGYFHSGVELIAIERARQRLKYGTQHDDAHTDGSLSVVAATCAVEGTDAKVVDPKGRGTPGRNPDYDPEEDHWSEEEIEGDPWRLLRKHAPDRIRLLQIAGALIAAEIDRLMRKREQDALNISVDDNRKL